MTQVDAATKLTFKRNNIGCWGYSGSAKRTDVNGAWTSGTIAARSTLLFDLRTNPGGTGLQLNDSIRLRVPISAPQFRSTSWTLNEIYTETGGTYQLSASGSPTSIVLGGQSSGVLLINNFAESLPATLRQDQFAAIGSAPGAYLLESHTLQAPYPGTVTGPQPQCGSLYYSAPGALALSSVGPSTAQVLQLDGRLKGSFDSATSPDSVVFTWDLAPMREP